MYEVVNGKTYFIQTCKINTCCRSNVSVRPDTKYSVLKKVFNLGLCEVHLPLKMFLGESSHNEAISYIRNKKGTSNESNKTKS